MVVDWTTGAFVRAPVAVVVASQWSSPAAASPAAAAAAQTASLVQLFMAKSQKSKANHDKWQPFYEKLQQLVEEQGSGSGSGGGVGVGIQNMDEELQEWLEEQRRQYQMRLEGKKW